jgi:pimeloyl-ACP methyl ester carboxylesterase
MHSALITIFASAGLMNCGKNSTESELMKQTVRRERTLVLSRAFNEMAIGTEAERIDGYDPMSEQREPRAAGDTGPDSFYGSRVESLAIDTGSAVLRGYVYWPDAVFVPPKRAVIFFSGSGGSNASMIGPVASAYNRAGVPAVGVDYRGFGASNNKAAPLDGSAISEASLYEDARAIYRYVREVIGVEAASIVLYGFSLGGAVAARLAADIAESAQTGTVPPKSAGNGERLGGLVLHSSIRDMTRAAAGTLPLPKPLAIVLGWLGGRLTGGAYDTASSLKRLAGSAPDIPVHFRGGSKEAGDSLSLEITGLDRISGFRNMTVYKGREGHQAAEPGSKQAANMTDGLAELAVFAAIRETEALSR